MFVDVALVTERHPQAVLLPKRAILYDNDIPYVFKLGADDRVARVRVEPVLESRFHIEPASGFAAGDRVVIAGQVGLKENALVAPQPAASASADPAPGAHAEPTAELTKPAAEPGKPTDAPAAKSAERPAP
jgi:membrane fusion protein (multidrug efflux system)